jgi:hypothetical protein
MGKGRPCKPHKNLLTYRLSSGQAFGSCSVMIRPSLVSNFERQPLRNQVVLGLSFTRGGKEVKQLHLEILHEGEH